VKLRSSGHFIMTRRRIEDLFIFFNTEPSSSLSFQRIHPPKGYITRDIAQRREIKGRRPAAVNRDNESLPTKSGTPNLKQLPNITVDCEYKDGIYIKTQTANSKCQHRQETVAGDGACKHAPSPGTSLATDDLHKQRSTPFETGESSCGPHTLKTELKRRPEMNSTASKDNQI
jgi:hypothetical protein